MSFEIYNNCYKYNFKFEDEKNLKENAKKLPKLKSRKVEWRKPKTRDDGVVEIGFPLYDEEVNKYRKLKSQLSINIKVVYGNKLKIVNSWCLPNRIYINGINSTIDSSGHIFIESNEINNITMEYDEKFTKLDKIFQNLDSITEVDLSNLDTSRITSMKAMFCI